MTTLTSTVATPMQPIPPGNTVASGSTDPGEAVHALWAMPDAQICLGKVIHKRLRPKPHALSYAVFSLLVDVDKIAETTRHWRLFSYNRFAPMSLYDRDHGPGDATSIAAQARKLLQDGGLSYDGGRIFLLCYPRIFGYVFNPLSVYFAYDKTGALTGLIYEVNNTFKERTSYVLPAGRRRPGGTYAQSCDKTMFVSPFAAGSGTYGFRITDPVIERGPGTASTPPDVAVGVSLRDPQGPLIKTHFTAQAHPLSDRAILSALIRRPLMTLKVMGAIHFEALKLWWKGVPLVRGHTSARYSVRYAGR